MMRPAQGVERLLEQTSGDVLVFLPGLREIRQTAGHLKDLAGERDLLVLSLHGDLPAEEQDLALLPQGRRKVVLATNVAETSVTVEGITAVVDTGLARMLVYDPQTGLDRLELTPISRASADQRAGRAGRTQPGICLRLWSEAGHRLRPEQTEPEIRRVDLAGPALQLLSWGDNAVDKFPWFEAPPAENVERSLILLHRLGAVDEKGITEMGRVLAALPVHPRIGCLLVEGKRWGHLAKAALAAAVLSERDPFSRTGERTSTDRQNTLSDVLDRVEAIEDFERHGSSGQEMLNRDAARFILHVRSQLIRMLEDGVIHRFAHAMTLRARNDKSACPLSPISGEEAVQRSLLAAFPDRLARRREPGSRKGIMVGGRGVRLAPSSGVTEPELFLCVEVDDHASVETLVWRGLGRRTRRVAAGKGEGGYRCAIRN